MTIWSAEAFLGFIKEKQASILETQERLGLVSGVASPGWMVLYAIKQLHNEEHCEIGKGPEFHYVTDNVVLARIYQPGKYCGWYNYLIPFDWPEGKPFVVDESWLPVGGIPSDAKIHYPCSSVSILEDKEPIIECNLQATMPGGHFARKRSGVRRFLKEPYRLGTYKDIKDLSLLDEWIARKQDVYSITYVDEYKFTMNPERVREYEAHWPCETLTVFKEDKLVGYGFAIAIGPTQWCFFTRLASPEQYLADFLMAKLAERCEARGGKYMYDMGIGWISGQLGLIRYKQKYVRDLNGRLQDLVCTSDQKPLFKVNYKVTDKHGIEVGNFPSLDNLVGTFELKGIDIINNFDKKLQFGDQELEELTVGFEAEYD